MKKSKIVMMFTVSILSYSSVLFASPSFFSGPLSTLGKVSTQQTILSATINPAAGEYVVANKYRWSYLANAGLSFEIGEVDDLVDSLDDLTTELDRLEQEADDLFKIVTLSEVIAVQNQFNEFLIELDKKGTIQVDIQTRVPVFPIAIRSDFLKGVVTLDAKLDMGINALFIDSPLEIIIPTFPDLNYRLTTDTAVNLNSAEVKSFSVGYSHDLDNSLFKGKTNHFTQDGGRLLVGAQLNMYQATLSSQIIAIDEDGENEDIGDLIGDGYDESQVDSKEFGLDLGILWIKDHFQFGASWKNINEPSFESTTLGQNCSAIASPTLQNNCLIAVSLGASGLLDLNPEYVMESQISIEAATTTANKHWIFAASYDINEVSGLAEDAYQWLTASASYFPDSLWIPSARVGWRSNFGGSELNYANVGLTLFGGTHIDFSLALDSIDVDGDSLPRSLAVNIGFERRF